MSNFQIREMAKEKKVFLWQVAERYGVSDFTFSRKLRRELPPQEQEKILAIIEELAKEAE